eukprot:1910024-Rhodomonas_salina.1
MERRSGDIGGTESVCTGRSLEGQLKDSQNTVVCALCCTRWCSVRVTDVGYGGTRRIGTSKARSTRLRSTSSRSADLCAYMPLAISACPSSPYVHHHNACTQVGVSGVWYARSDVRVW